jgi:NitT/TauT family transport system ATP-binding protein
MRIDPIPQVGISRVIGLLEVLEDAGGRYDIFRLARDINYEFGEIVQVIKAAEMLDLVATPGADVALTSTGSAFLKADVNERKRRLKEQLRQLPLFRAVVETLEQREEHRGGEDVFREIIALHLPAENAGALLKTVVDWGRYAELLGYSPDEQVVYLDQP